MASIADVFVTVLPETSKIADGIKRALAGLDDDMRKAGQRWGKEIQRGLKDVEVDVSADTAKARKEIDKTVKDREVEIAVDADVTAAEAAIDTVARDRTVHVQVDVDQDSLAKARALIGGGGDGRGGGLGGSLSGAAKREGVIGRNLIGA